MGTDAPEFVDVHPYREGREGKRASEPDKKWEGSEEEKETLKRCKSPLAQMTLLDGVLTELVTLEASSEQAIPASLLPPGTHPET